MKLSVKPLKVVNLGDIQDETVAEAFRTILRLMEESEKNAAITVNFNEITYISQNAQPTPAEGQVMLWKDADAGVGQPKAYIVATGGGATYTFRSVEVV